MIKIRTRTLKNGAKSYLLDICHRGKRYKEFLKIRTEVGTDLATRNRNKEKKEIVNKIRLQRENELINNEYGFKKATNSNADFFQYYEVFISSLTIVNTRTDASTLIKLREFHTRKTLPFSELTENFLIRFKAYLESKLTGETPYDYFKKLKRVIKAAEKEGYVKNNCARDIINKRGKEGIEKNVLKPTELSVLAHTPCSNSEVKRAFLLCTCTGLRFCDVQALKWQHIKGGAIEIKQKKTKVKVIINLSSDALTLIGERGLPNDLIFDLPSHTACLKTLKNWTEDAKIDKHITWHCARHSFGTNLVAYGTDVVTVSGLLGHTSLDYTQRYVRLNKDMQETAIQRLPSIL